MGDSAQHPQTQLCSHGTKSGQQGTGQEGSAGSAWKEEKWRASGERKVTNSQALKVPQKDPSFTGAPALGTPHTGPQGGVPPRLWVPSYLIRVTPASVPPSVGGQEGVRNTQLNQLRVPGSLGLCRVGTRERAAPALPSPPPPPPACLRTEWGERREGGQGEGAGGSHRGKELRAQLLSFFLGAQKLDLRVRVPPHAPTLRFHSLRAVFCPWDLVSEERGSKAGWK